MSIAKARVAVVGAGMAGSACARLLADAGIEVELFDKSRGVGGRMSTRRAEWSTTDGAEHRAYFDHGAPCFSAHAPEFVRAVEQAERDGLLSRWTPRMAPSSTASFDQSALWVATPDMPAWCRALSLSSSLAVHTGCSVDSLRRSPLGWCLESAGLTVGEGFDAVVVAIPPLQAQALLQAHHAEWAQRAAAIAMLPCWALMAVTDDSASLPAWDLATPSSSILACVVRNDSKPGRHKVPGLAHWVLHATAAWSQTNLEMPAADAQAQLQAELVRWLGLPLTWHHTAVHRWRYSSASQPVPNGGAMAFADRCWWDADLGLGVCGDALGGSGVEGAWRSARALAAAIKPTRTYP